MNTDKKQAMEKIMNTQSDYIHCDFIYPDNHKCKRIAPHFRGGVEDKHGKINSFVLCNEHKYIAGWLSPETALLISCGVAVLALPLATVSLAIPIIAFGLTLLATSIYGQTRKV